MYAHNIIVLYALHTKYIKKTKDEDSFQMVNSHGRALLQCANRIVYIYLPDRINCGAHILFSISFHSQTVSLLDRVHLTKSNFITQALARTAYIQARR